MPKKNQSKQDSIEKELADLNDAAGNLMDSSHCQSAFRVYGELRSRAKSEGHLAYYVFGTFFQMNLAQKLLQFETVRERAVELIAIFEDEEQARKIEPSMDLEQYGSIIYSMGACAYEVLAEATGELDGFNSEGMQECLTGGIEVCHRIGKLSCVQCFREYACDIHIAADDYELARYHSNQVLQQNSDFPERGDRRWLANLRLARMDMLEGQHESARIKLEQATLLAKAKSVTDSMGAQIAVMLERRTLDLLEDRQVDARTEETIQLLPPRGECPEYDLAMDSLAALKFAKESQWDQAENLLVPWNRSLRQNKSITKWLENGVRLVALYRLQGDFVKAKRLCGPFEDAATKANDWQTIRRLNQTLDDSKPITPLGTVIKNSRFIPSKPWEELVEPSKTETVKPELSQASPKSSPESEITSISASPLSAWLDDLAVRTRNRVDSKWERDDVAIDPLLILRELLDKDRSAFIHPVDIGKALYLVNFLITPVIDRVEVWKWANQLVSTHQDVGYLISLLGRLGMTISMIDRLSAEMARELAFKDFDDDPMMPDFTGTEEIDDLEDLDPSDLDDEEIDDGEIDDGEIDDGEPGDGAFDKSSQNGAFTDSLKLPDDSFLNADLDSNDEEEDLIHDPEESEEVSFATFFGNLAAQARDLSGLSDSSISNERLDQLVRKSLLIDSTSVNNNFRAAEVYEYIGKEGEAERCYARAFKLDRRRDDAALALSRIYSESDRLQDSLYVLDLCIREGGDSPELLFEAALKAHALSQYELQVSFLQKYHQRHQPISWTYYYLSSGLLELKRPDEALVAIEKEVSLFNSHGLHIDSVRAAAYAQLGQSDQAIAQIKKALAHPLVEIDNLTISGISGAYERLINAARTCPDEKDIQALVEDRMLKAGIATESFFEHARSGEKPCDLYLYQCYVLQPLESTWFDYEGCLANQTEWEAYMAQWGVLARDEDEAEAIALKWQRKCYTLEPELMDIQVDEELLHDRPGIAFQGARFPDLDDDEEDELDFEDGFGGNDHGGFGPKFDRDAPF